MKALKHNWVAFVLLVFSFLLSFSCVRNDRSIEIEILPEGSDSKTLFFLDGGVLRDMARLYHITHNYIYPLSIGISEVSNNVRHHI